MSARNVGVTLGVLGSLFACGGSVAVGRTGSANGELQTTQDGKPTGNGATCSWTGTALLAAHPSADVPATYEVGASFESIDGCNGCSCTAQGIMCTIRSCTAVDAGPVACPALARVCNDGSSPTPGPNCQQICPEDGSPPIDAGAGFGDACPAIAKLCPDGSSVSPTGPSCTYPACPASDCTSLGAGAEADVGKAQSANLACTADTDCEIFNFAADCFSACTRPVAKAGETAVKNAIASANGSQCKTFVSEGCKLIEPPCVGPGSAHCVNQVCEEMR